MKEFINDIWPLVISFVVMSFMLMSVDRVLESQGRPTIYDEVIQFLEDTFGKRR